MQQIITLDPKPTVLSRQQGVMQCHKRAGGIILHALNQDRKAAYYSPC